MTWLEEYGTAVLDGKISACKRLKQMYERLLNALYNPGKYHFDEQLANRHIAFIETFCKQAQGKLGTPLKLELFQKAKFQAIYGFVDDNDLRQCNEVLCHPSKNGHRKASKNGMNRSLSFVFEIRPHLFHGSLDNEPLPT